MDPVLQVIYKWSLDFKDLSDCLTMSKGVTSFGWEAKNYGCMGCSAKTIQDFLYKYWNGR